MIPYSYDLLSACSHVGWSPALRWGHTGRLVPIDSSTHYPALETVGLHCHTPTLSHACLYREVVCRPTIFWWSLVWPTVWEADTLTTTSKPTRHGNMSLTITLHDTRVIIFNPCNYRPISFVKCTMHWKVIPFYTKWNESSVISREFRKREREGDISGDLWKFSGVGRDTSNHSKIRETPERFWRLANTAYILDLRRLSHDRAVPCRYYQPTTCFYLGFWPTRPHAQDYLFKYVECWVSVISLGPGLLTFNTVIFELGYQRTNFPVWVQGKL